MGQVRQLESNPWKAAGVNEGQSFTFNGVTFTWPASYSVIPDNYQAAGQTILVTPVNGATTLAFLGAEADGGTTADSGTVHFKKDTRTIKAG